MAFDPRLGTRFLSDVVGIAGTISDTWRAEVGRARLGIEPDQAEALEEGASHRVHYLAAPDGAIPISMERL